MKKITSVVIVDTCTKRLTALKAHVSNKAEIPIAGKVYKAAAVVGIYQNSLDIRASLSTKRADVKATIVESVNAESLRRAADKALKGWVVNTFGADSQQAHDFGFPPPKAPVRTVENKAEAKLLAEATRKARHTMGKKQKLQVKGTLSAPTVPAAPAPQTVQAAAPAVVSTPAPVAAAPGPVAVAAAPVATAPAPVTPAPAPATNGVAPVQNGAPHA